MPRGRPLALGVGEDRPNTSVVYAPDGPGLSHRPGGRCAAVRSKDSGTRAEQLRVEFTDIDHSPVPF